MARKNSKDAGHRAGVITARAQSYTGRIVAARDEIQRFLIVCEGEQTEPNYFRSFRVPKEVVDVHGVGDNTKSLVEKAITLRDAAKETDNPYDQVWCVFDRDSFPAKHVNEALRLAISAGIHTALSNEAFEIWYLLHFDYHDVGISRQAYNDKLNRLLKQPYQKNSRTIYDELYSRQANAIRNARKLHSQYQPARPEKDNPCTTVYLLVEALNIFLI